MRLPVSVLDLSPVGVGVAPSQAIRDSVELAVHADELGYTRYWFAEHHDRVTPMLPALREYQLSLLPPAPPAGSFDALAAERGKVLFDGQARCAQCHAGASFTDAPLLHAPSETGMEPNEARRSATGMYRTTPLRGAWQHPPYFHDGSALTLGAVIEHYDDVLDLQLTAPQRADLEQYLMSL